MWIRSQDKTELVNTQRIQAESKCIYVFEGVAMDDCSYVQMGKYKTKERTLEVLDEIQDRIGQLELTKTVASNKNISINSFNIEGFIYKMPKE